jgi:AcrR family transcriptional regulator
MPKTATQLTADAEPARKKGRERRRQILDAARQRVIDVGIDGLVLREIAEDMGITHGNLQYYFQTKDDLLKAIFDEEVEKYTGGMKLAIDASAPKDRLSAIVDSSLDLLKSEDTRLWRAMFAVADRNRDFADILKRENEHYETAVAEELKSIEPSLTPARRRLIARMIRLMMDGLALELIYEDPNSPKIAAIRAEIKKAARSMLSVRH